MRLADGANLQNKIRIMHDELKEMDQAYLRLLQTTHNIRDAADSLQRDNLALQEKNQALLPYLLSRFEPTIGWTMPSSKSLKDGRLNYGLIVKVPFTPFELGMMYASRETNTRYDPVTVRETKAIAGPFNMTGVSEMTSSKNVTRGSAIDFNLGLAITDYVSMLFGLGEEKRIAVTNSMYSTYFLANGTNERIDAQDTPQQTVDNAILKRYSAGFKVNLFNPISVSYVVTKIENDNALEHNIRLGLNLNDIFSP